MNLAASFAFWMFLVYAATMDWIMHYNHEPALAQIRQTPPRPLPTRKCLTWVAVATAAFVAILVAHRSNEHIWFAIAATVLLLLAMLLPIIAYWMRGCVWHQGDTEP